ncbi:non-ribosomal peptide synthetase [Streptomyces sp. ICBB 8177]|uniref:non-ribosomal peptide synthetase n=1 Tax=Streptomyces sp. ICBB 8177 TaxID=563922 RepID=UPI0018EE9ECC|nr:non-ribosomal peptide synthetase [Streptomyces sp. ICBB 8177]
MSQAWEGFRLSKQQEHVLGLVADGRAGRTVARAALGTPLDREVLERAVADVVSAHESLRTVYRKVLGDNSTALMVIEDRPRFRLSERSGDEAALTALVREEARAQTDEEDAAPLRLTLFTCADGQRSLVVSAPRMSMDALSAEVFLRDLGDACAARTQGASWSRDGIVQYADYAQWQVEEGAPSPRQKELAAGRAARLKELPPLNLPLELLSDDTTVADLRWTVPAPLARRLRRLGDDCDGGLRSVLLTGWFVALWHAAGRPEHLAVNALLTRRPFPELRTSIGLFETPAPVFAAVGDETTLTDLLRSVDLELDTFEQADESSMDPAGQHFTAIPGFAFHEVTELGSAREAAFHDLWIEPSDDARKVALSAQDLDGEIRLTLRHQTLGMAEGGAEALLACLRAALSALGGDLGAAVPDLAMLDEDAARELVAATNPAQPPARPAEHWHRQVERTARFAPDAPALRTAARSWTYRQFDEAANRLANELAGRGVRAGELVGLCLERSDLALVAMLAIAKAGAGYVPVDPSLPAKRRSAVLDAVGLRHAVATAETAPTLPGECDTVVLDADLTVCAHRASDCPDVATTDDDPAYVIFTSGSTGTPKGVLVGHGHLAAYLDGVLDRLRLTGPVDSVALSTLGTDLGNTALFPPLVTGGELLVVAPEVSADAQALAELLSRESYDLLKITPSHLEAVFTVAEEPERLMPHQALVAGGEPFGWGWYNLFKDYLGDCRLFNHYGPTETTVGVLCGQATSSDDLAALASSVPLGTPMRHARAYVLDSGRRPLPAGVPGELWIGGSSVSHGYLSTAQGPQDRFVPDPFSPDPSGRMYRTGDKARLLPDGTVEFLGRVDRQIKLRGFRVELGEIEAVMRQHPRVTGSLVVEAGESTGAHLVGYLVDAEGDRGSAEWLREFLAERLPDFMLPAHLVALEAFPLTGTGKVDASMLPEPGFYTQQSATYVEPRTETERRVADIVAQLLLLRRVGADDDFFEVGGHSLLATQLVARLRDDFKVSFKLRNLFEFPVVSELAEFIDRLLEKKAAEAC